MHPINIFLTALVGQSSQGRTPTRPRDKRDKITIFSAELNRKHGRFVPERGPRLSRGEVPFVPGTVPVCPGHRPAQNAYVYWFFLPELAGTCANTMIATPLRHSGKRPIKVGNGPLRRGNGPLTLMGSFRALRHGGKRPLPVSPYPLNLGGAISLPKFWGWSV